MSKVHNFSAGPCILPSSVFEEASKSILEFQNSGLSILEMSHRSSYIIDVMSEARNLVKKLLNVPDGYTVLFLQGGASLGFLISAYNMTSEFKKSAYINTGTWSSKSIKEAKRINEVAEIASGKESNFKSIPKSYHLPSECDYLHYTTNNTIYGTQFKAIPSVNCPLVADMSSDLFSQQIDVSKFDLIYAGAQKNLGPAGTTLYIVKDELFERRSLEIPSMLDLKTHADKDSMFNTPPVFSIYVSLLTLRWLDNLGGIDQMELITKKKAEILYNSIDQSSLFEGISALEDRSNMNVTFQLTNKELEAEFLAECDRLSISGIKGHRSVGGFRASIYNAMPIESIETLTKLINQFDQKKS